MFPAFSCLGQGLIWDGVLDFETIFFKSNLVIRFGLKTGIWGLGELTEQLRVCTALAKDTGSVPSTHKEAHNPL